MSINILKQKLDIKISILLQSVKITRYKNKENKKYFITIHQSFYTI